jgi:DNA-binding LytR/AlgR family response regulator
MSRIQPLETCFVALLEQQKAASVKVRDGSEWYPLSAHQIIMARCEGHYCTLTTANRVNGALSEIRDLRINLKEFEGLQELCICRISRNVVVNLAYLHRVEKRFTIYLEHAPALPIEVGESYKEDFIRAMERLGL